MSKTKVRKINTKTATGEVKEQVRSITKEEQDKFLDLVKKIGADEEVGFFYVGRRIDAKDGFTMDGGLYSNKMSRDQVIRVLAHTLGIDPDILLLAMKLGTK